MACFCNKTAQIIAKIAEKISTSLIDCT